MASGSPFNPTDQCSKHERELCSLAFSFGLNEEKNGEWQERTFNVENMFKDALSAIF